jgi:Tfp pilus assembly pilus retraction ATPase PilT
VLCFTAGFGVTADRKRAWEKSLFIQREIGTDTPSCRDALVSALRQDPDVIILGEIRDYETAEICLKGAETGQLVMSAIHTPGAEKTIQRFVGLFPREDHEGARVRLADTLKATVSLRLLPTVDSKARVARPDVSPCGSQNLLRTGDARVANPADRSLRDAGRPIRCIH